MLRVACFYDLHTYICTRTNPEVMALKTDVIEIYESRRKPKHYGWRYKTKNGKKVAIAGELYEKRDHTLRMVTGLFSYPISQELVLVVDLTTKKPK